MAATVRSPVIRRAARSAIASTVALVFAVTIDGITEASAIRRFSIPWTLSCGPTTDIGSVPILQVPTGWKYVETAERT